MNELLNLYNNAVKSCDNNNDDLFSDDFLFVIPTLNISQKIQTVLSPEIICEPIEQGYYNKIAKFASNRIVITKLIVDLKVNKNLYNLKVLTDWIKLYGTYNNIKSDDDTLSQYDHLYHDMYLFFINPIDGATPLAYIHYKNCFPTAISSPSFDPSSTTPIRISVNFEVEDYEVVIV